MRIIERTVTVDAAIDTLSVITGTHILHLEYTQLEDRATASYDGWFITLWGERGRRHTVVLADSTSDSGHIVLHFSDRYLPI